MKFFTAAIASALLAVQAAATTVSWDDNYGDPNASLNNFACSDGQNGLAAKYPTLGKIPTFPYVGATGNISGWNSPKCGACYKLAYQGRVIYVVGVDHAQGDQFVLGKAAMGKLLHGGEAEAVQRGRVTLSGAKEVDKKYCKGA